MASKKRVYRLPSNGAAYLNHEFYANYDPYFLRNKARVLMTVVEKQEEFQPLMGEPDEYSPVEVNQQFTNGLRAEIHFTAFHQFECLFALLFAAYQELPHWLFLTTYRDEVKDKAKAFLEDDIAKVTDGKETDRHKFLARALYSGILPLQDEEAWKKELDAADWLLKRIADKFSGNEYNAYKHGLRVMTTGESSITITGLDKETRQPLETPGATFHSSSKDSFTFLEVSKIADDAHEVTYAVHMDSQHFDAYESLIYLENMAQLLYTMRNTRLAGLTPGTHQVTMTLFSELDQTELLKLSPPLLRFRRTFGGDEATGIEETQSGQS